MKALLAGGPYHGREVEIPDGQSYYLVAIAPPITTFFREAKPPRPPWHHPRARRLWDRTPELTYDAPTFHQVEYRKIAPHLFSFAGDALHPPVSASELMHYVYRALGEADPALRQMGHWEMGGEWYAAIRHALSHPGHHHPGDSLLGMTVRIHGSLGMPRIVENKVVV